MMSKEDLALLEEAEKAEKAEKDKKEKAEKEKADKKKDKKGTKTEDKKEDSDKKEREEVKPLTFDLENRFDRIVRLTVNSSRLGDAVLNSER